MSDNSIYTAIIPPRIEDVKIYFSQRGMPETEADTFFLFYEKRLWVSKKGRNLKSWKNIAYSWIGTVISNQPLLFNRMIH